MTLPATQEHRPLMALYKDEGRSVIARFFAAYDVPYLDPKASERGREAVLTAKAQSYLVGIEGIPEWALAEAFKDFVQGRVDRPERQRGKLPTAEQICDAARLHVRREARERDAERARQDAMRRPAETPPAEKARMALKLELWRMSIGMTNGADELLRANAGGLQSLVALAEQWGVSVSDEVRSQL